MPCADAEVAAKPVSKTAAEMREDRCIAPPGRDDYKEGVPP
jgi:hypothetical protein